MDASSRFSGFQASLTSVIKQSIDLFRHSSVHWRTRMSNALRQNASPGRHTVAADSTPKIRHVDFVCFITRNIAYFSSSGWGIPEARLCISRPDPIED
jgi:hypothetical protein